MPTPSKPPTALKPSESKPSVEARTSPVESEYEELKVVPPEEDDQRKKTARDDDVEGVDATPSKETATPTALGLDVGDGQDVTQGGDKMPTPSKPPEALKPQTPTASGPSTPFEPPTVWGPDKPPGVGERHVWQGPAPLLAIE